MRRRTQVTIFGISAITLLMFFQLLNTLGWAWEFTGNTIPTYYYGLIAIGMIVCFVALLMSDLKKRKKPQPKIRYY